MESVNFSPFSSHQSMTKKSNFLTQLQRKVCSIASAIFHFFATRFHAIKKFFANKFHKQKSIEFPLSNHNPVKKVNENILSSTLQPSNLSLQFNKNKGNIIGSNDNIDPQFILNTDDLKKSISKNDIPQLKMCLSKIEANQLKKMIIDVNECSLTEVYFYLQSCPKLSHLTLKNCNKFKDDQLKFILNHCPNLIDLTIDCTSISPYITSNLFSYLPANLLSLSVEHHGIKHADLQNLKNLQKLRISSGNLKAMALPHSIKNLKIKICLDDPFDSQALSHLTQLETLDIYAALTGNLAHLPKSIKDLKIFNCKYLNEINLTHMTPLKMLWLERAENVNPLSYALPHQLEEINLVNTTVTDQSLAYFPVSLKKLTLMSRQDILNPSVNPTPLSISKTDLSQLIHLEKLWIVNSDINSNTIEKLPISLQDLQLVTCPQLAANVDFSHLMHLKIIAIIECTNITNDFFKTIPKKLQSAYFDGCSKLSQQDLQLLPNPSVKASMY